MNGESTETSTDIDACNQKVKLMNNLPLWFVHSFISRERFVVIQAVRAASLFLH